MADALGTTVTIRGDSGQFKASIDEDIIALRSFGETIKTTNRTAVAAFESESAGLRAFGVQAGATKEQLIELDQVIATTNARIAESGVTAGSTSQIFRGLFMEAGQRDPMGRGMLTMVTGITNQFGGPWIGALAIAGFALERLFLKSEKGFDDMKKMLHDVDEQFKTLSLSGQSAAIVTTEAHMAELRKAQAELADPKWLLAQTDPQIVQSMIAQHEALAAHVEELKKIVAHEHELLDANSVILVQESIKKQMLEASQAIVKDTKELHTAEAAGYLDLAQKFAAQLARDRQLLTDLQTAAARIVPEGSKLRAELADVPITMNVELRKAAGEEELQGIRKKDEALTRSADHAITESERVLDKLMADVEKARGNPALKALIEQLHMGQDETGGHGAFEDPVKAAMEQGMRIGKAFLEGQQKAAKGQHHLAAGEQFTVPPDALERWGKFKLLIHDLSLEFQHVTVAIGLMSDAQKTANDVMTAATANVIQTAVSAQKESVAALTAAALQPVVSYIEGLAIQYAAAGVAATLTGNPVLGAEDLAAAAVLTAAAHEVSAFASGLTMHGGSGGGGGGGSSRERAPLGTSGIGALAGQRAGQAAMTLEVIITTKAPDGKTLQRERQLLQRLDNRDVPYRVNIG